MLSQAVGTTENPRSTDNYTVMALMAPALALLLPISAFPFLLPSGTGDETVLNVARLPVMSNKKCSMVHRGQVKDSELCTAPLKAGVGACEVSSGGRLLGECHGRKGCVRESNRAVGGVRWGVRREPYTVG